jgi:hypothetical protein
MILLLIVSDFHFIVFCNNNIFIEQGCQPCIQSSTWRTRSAVFMSPVGSTHSNMDSDLFSIRSDSRLYNKIEWLKYLVNSWLSIPYRGGVEYLHHNPASRMRQRKGKSRIWDSKICSRAPRDWVLRMTALATASRNHKWETSPLVRESTSNQQICNCLTVIKI